VQRIIRLILTSIIRQKSNIIKRLFTFIISCISCCLILQIYPVSAQSNLKNRGGIGNSVDKPVGDSLKIAKKLLISAGDSLINPLDSLTSDSLNVSNVLADTIKLPTATGDLTEPIIYQAKDSIIYDIENEMIHLFNGSSVKYNDTEIAAPEMHFNYVDKTVTANVGTDSIKTKGKLAKERVVLMQDGKEYEGDKMVYNFETEKGKINQLLTSDDGEGFIHGEEVKMNEYGELFAKDAYYTTCEADHPHFHINVEKVKIIPNKLIVSGPANLVIADVPTPLVLPFGIFPLNKNRSSGIILPTYGRDFRMGFFLQNGGYYWAGNDHMDLSVLGDIFTNGTWKISLASNYKMRYRYNGNIKLSFGRDFIEDRITPDFMADNHYSIYWRHTQDGKARPNHSFGATVDIRSAKINRTFVNNSQSDLTNVLTSNINYGYNFPRSPFSFNVSANHRHNLNTHDFTISLPNASLNMSTIYPFEKKVRVGSKKWYESTNIRYTGRFNNTLETLDSLIFEKETYRNFKTSISHSIPINVNIKLFKYFTFNPNITYTENWFFKYLDWSYDADSIPAGSETAGTIKADTLRGFAQSRKFGNIGPSLNTTLYGIFNFKRGKVKAFRHVLTPNISYNFLPDFSRPFWKNYDTVEYINAEGRDTTFKALRFTGGQSISSRRTSNLGFGFGNRFDMKIRTPKDSINKEKKIELIRILNIRSSYDFEKDSFNMADISLSANTNFLNKITVNFNAAFDPYVYDTLLGRRVDTLLVTHKKRKLARLKWASLKLGTSFGSKDVEEYFSEKGTESDIWEINQYPERFLDFNQKWNISLNYNFRIEKRLDYSENKSIDSLAVTSHNLDVNFDFNLTDKWKLSGNTGYNFKDNIVTGTNLRITRDLHCWQMSFNVTPFGRSRSYNFRINVKASVLQDLKLTRARNWYDF